MTGVLHELCPFSVVKMYTATMTKSYYTLHKVAGIDVLEFKDFFPGEKQRELDKLAKEQACKGRHGKEQR